MNIAITVASYLYLYYFGRSVLNTFKKGKYSDVQIAGIPINYFYIIVSLFLFGNIALLLNFVVPLKNVIFYIIPFSLTLITYDLIKNKKLNLTNTKLFELFVTPSVLSIATYNVWLGWDTGMYHIPHQYILRENPIIFGLTNLNIWFGWSSIIEYISSLFWFNGNFIFLRIIEICIFAVFFNIVLFFLLQNKSRFYKYSAFGIIIFGFLDNFGYMGGGNGFVPMLSVGKYDSALGIIFFIVCIAILESIKTNNYDKVNFYSIVTLSLFGFQMKQTGAYLIFILIPYLILFLKKNNLSLLNTLNQIKFPIFLFMFWEVKNIITTSCLFYPIELTCLPFLSWHETVQLDFVSRTMIYSPISLSSDLTIFEQAYNWFNFSKNSQFIINFPTSLLLILMFFFVITFRQDTIEKNKIITKWFAIFLVLNSIIWYNSNYGNFRYGTGLWLLLVTFIALIYSNKHIIKEDLLTKFMAVIFLLTLLQVPRFYSYESFLSSNFELVEININYEDTEYFVSEYGWGVYPSSVQCWDKEDCKVKDKNVSPQDYLYTTIFFPDGVSGD